MKVELIREPEPFIWILPKVYQDIVDIVSLGDQNEVAWFHTVKREKDIFTITDTYFPQQEVKPAHNRMTAKGQHDLVPFEDKADGMVLCWGHSHVNMSPSPSSTDDATLDEYFEDGYPFYIRIITNKSLTLDITLVTQEGWKAYIDDAHWSILFPNRREHWKEIMKQNCIKPEYDYKYWNRHSNRKYQKDSYFLNQGFGFQEDLYIDMPDTDTLQITEDDLFNIYDKIEKPIDKILYREVKIIKK